MSFMDILRQFIARFSGHPTASPFDGGFALATTGNPDAAVVRDVLVAADWVATALRSSGYAADFSVDSLKEIDRFFDDQARGGRPVPGGLLAEETGARLFALSGYVGEVVRRKAGGEWLGDDNDPMAEVNVGVRLADGSMIWPGWRVGKRLQNGSEDGLHVYGLSLTGGLTPVEL